MLNHNKDKLEDFIFPSLSPNTYTRWDIIHEDYYSSIKTIGFDCRTFDVVKGCSTTNLEKNIYDYSNL